MEHFHKHNRPKRPEIIPKRFGLFRILIMFPVERSCRRGHHHPRAAAAQFMNVSMTLH